MPYPRCTAVIVASGMARRMGFDKLAADLAGKPVLVRAMHAVAASRWVAEVILVCPDQRWQAMGCPQPDGINFQRVDGGAERADSVAAGVAAASHAVVCVHDGARPLVATADVDRCIAAAVQFGAAALARRVTETLRRADAEDLAGEWIDREQLWAMETPQCANRDALLAALAHARAIGRIVTDETSALALSGIRAKLIPSAFPNPKITTAADLRVAAALIS